MVAFRRQPEEPCEPEEPEEPCEPGDSDEPCEPEEPETPDEPEDPETPEETAGPSPESSLPITGGDVAVASVLAATALAVGLVLLIIVRRRQL